MAARFCVKCGKPLVPDAQFCAMCGAAVPTPPEGGSDSSEKGQPPEGAKSRWPVSPKTLGAVIAVFFVLVSFFAEDDRRDAVVGFIETRLQEPVEELNPWSVTGHFFGVLNPSCPSTSYIPLGPDGQLPDYLQPVPTFTNPFATPRLFATPRPSLLPTARPVPTIKPFTLDDVCGTDGIWGYITRVPKAFSSTARYVFSHGWASVVIVALPAGFFVVAMLGMSKKDDYPAVLNPIMWLVVLPIFTGLFAWALQLLVLLLLIVVKYTIASCAVLGIGFILFDKFKLWEDVRKLTERAGEKLKIVPRRPSGGAPA